MKLSIVKGLLSLGLVLCSLLTFGQLPFSPCSPTGGKRADVLGVESKYRAPGAPSPVFNIPAGTRSITVYISSETGLTSGSDNPQGDEDFITINAIIDLSSNTSSGYVNYAQNTNTNGSGTNLYGWQKVPLGAFIPTANKVGDATPNLNNVNFSVSGSTLTITEGTTTTHSSYYLEYASPYNNSLNLLDPAVKALLHGTATANTDLVVPIPTGTNLICISGKGTNTNATDLNTSSGTEEGYSNLRFTIDVDAGLTDGFVTLANGGSVDRRSTYVINNLSSASTMDFLSSAAITGDYTSKLVTAGAVGVFNPKMYISGTNLVIKRDANYARDFDDAYVIEFYKRTGQGMSAEFINSDIQTVAKGLSSATGVTRTFTIPPGTSAMYLNEAGNACNTDRESNENSLAAYAYIDLTTETATGYFYQQVGLDGVNRRDDNFAFKGVPLNNSSTRNHANTVGFKGPNNYDISFSLSADKTQLTVTNKTGLANPDYQLLLSMDYYGARPDIAFNTTNITFGKGSSCKTVRANVNVCNPGSGNSSGGMPVSFYHGDPTTDPAAVLLYTGTFNQDILEGQCKTFSYDIDLSSFSNLDMDMTIIINDNGSFVPGGVGHAVGTPFTLGSLASQNTGYKECYYDNNLVTKSVDVNNCPIVNLDPDNSSGATGAYNYLNYFNAGSSGAKITDADVNIIDPDGGNMQTATITLTNRPDGANEGLFINGTLPPAFVVTGVGTATITISGNASQAAYIAALKMIEYRNTQGAPNTTNRIITTTLNDGIETGPPSTTTIVMLTDPRINVTGSGTLVADNSTTVTTVDGTDFGIITSGTVTHTFSINNVGTGVINLVNTPAVIFASGDPGFTISAQPALTAISAGGSTNFNVTFNSASHAVGTYTAVIRIRNNDADADRADYTFTVSVTVNNIPAVTNNTVNGLEDNTLTFAATDFTNQYTDPDGTPLNKIRITSLPLNGSFRLSGVVITVGQEIPAAQLANITFIPTANWNGTTSFDWRASDGTSYSTSTAHTTINIQPANDAPVITVPTSIAVTEDIPASLKDISFSDIDAGTGNVTVTFSVPSGTLSAVSGSGVTVSGTPGSLVLTGALSDINAFLTSNKVTYSSTQNPPATVLLTVNISDNGNTGIGGALQDTKTVPLGITAVNDVPTGTGDTKTTLEDTPVSGAVTGADVDGDALTFTKATDPAHGTVVVNPDGTYTYTPAANYNGPDSFTIGISDGHGGSTTVTVNITVTAVNDAPTGTGDTKTTLEDTPVSGAVTGTDVDGDALTYTKATDPAHGSVVVNPDGTYTYTPAANYNGPDSFTIGISDGHGGTTTVTVNITVTAVNDAPTGTGDTKTTLEDTPVSGSVSGSDVDGDALTYTKATDPAHGSVVVNPDGTYTYTPAANYNGPDSFTIGISDGHGGTTTVTVNITVTAVNDAPTGTGDTKTTLEDTPVSGAVTGTDVDGDALTYTKATDPAHGTAVVNADGTYTYTPAADYNGPDSFTIGISDGHGGTITVTVNITVTAVNDAPTGTGDTKTTLEDTPVSGAVSGSDVDGDALTYTKATDPAHGSVVVNPDGTYTYTPAANYNGPDTFTIDISDGHGGSTTVTVNITVTAVNDAPTGTGDTKTTLEDTPVNGAVTGTDVDGDALTYTKATDPAHGTAVVNTDGTYTYTPAANYNGPDSFTIGISDGHGGTTTVTVNIIVTAVNDAPTGTGDTKTTLEDTPVSGAVTGSDVDGDALTYTKATDPAHGTAVVNADGTYTYTPAADYNGPDSFTIGISDGHGGATTVTVNITVTAVNDAPTGTGDTKTTLEDTPVSGSVTGSDVDGDPLTYTKATDPAHGTAVVNADGTYTYTPAADYNGPDSFTIGISDGHGGTTTVTVNITVTAVNDAPTGTGDTKTTLEDTPVSGAVTGSDVDGDALTYTKATDPAHGTAVVNTDGTYTYTPAADYNGPDSFTIEINDGHGGTTTVTVNITVTAVNDAPTGTGDTKTTLEDTPVSGSVTGSDVDGDALTYTKATDPAHGTAVVNPDGTYTYTPGTDYNGPDSFTIEISDGHGGTTTATVNITVTAVNDAPTGTGDTKTTLEDTPVNGSVTGSDVDGDPLTYTKATDPAHGTAVVNTDGTYTYTPAADYNGPDSFTIEINDGHGGTTTVTVNITVTAANDAPTGTGDTKTTLEDTPVSGSVTGSDVDGDALTYTKATDPAHGTAVVNADGTYTYTPAADYNGPDSFTIGISDGHGGTTTVTVNITVTAVNDAPIGTGDTKTTLEDTPVNGSVAGSDVDGDPLTYTKATDPAHGTAVVNSDGTYTYTPAADYNGPDSFTIGISDGHGGTTTVTVNITVTAVNDAPTGTGDTKTTLEDTPVSGSVTGTDTDGDPLTYTKATDPAHGSVVVNPDGTYTYTPAADYNGPDSFTIEINDGHGGTTTVTVNITVTAVNDAPTGTGDTKTTTEDTPVSGSVTGSDVDGDPLTYTKATDPAHGTAVVNSDGTYTYTPAADYNGPDSFTIGISDGHGGTTTVTVNITVTAVNDAPTGTGDTKTTLEDTPVSGSVTGTDTDGDPLTYTKATDPAHGTAVVNTDGTYTYTPAANYNGPDSFTIEINDGHGGTTTVTVNITVTAVNDAPIGTGDTKTTLEDTPVNGSVAGSDVDGDPLTYTKATDPAHGTAVVNSDGTYTYTPAADYNGPDSFTIGISDGHGGTTTVTVNITVTAVNDAPTGTGDTKTTLEDTPVSGSVTGTDTDSDPLTYTKATNPAHGTAVVNTDGTYTYTPAADYNGPDSFTIEINDGHGGTTTVTVNITVTAVNDAPTGTGDTKTTLEDTPVSGSVSGSDVDGDALTYTKATDPAHGSVVVNLDGTYTYTPAADYNGPDSFTIEINDGHGGTTTVTVNITVTAVNDAPTGTGDTKTTLEDTPVSGSVAGTDTDGDALTYTKATDPAHGTVVVNPDGTYTYTPGTDYNGPDSFTIEINDGHGGTTTVTVNITVTAVNDAPTGTGDTKTTLEDTPVNGAVTGADTDGDPLTYTKATDPAHGTAVVNTDGTYTYTPAADYNGPDSFTIEINDGHGGTTTVTVNITVTAVNDAPTGTGDTKTTTEDTPVSGSVTGADVDGDLLTYTKATDPSHGSVVVNSDGTYTYTPAANYNGPDSFTIEINDGHGGTTTVTVNITVTAVNDAPTGTGDTKTTLEDTPVNGAVTGSDTDSDPLTYTKATDPAHGTVVVNPDGTYTYTPAVDYNGPDSFTIEINDGHGGTTTVTVNITVTAVNDAPTGTGDTKTTLEDTPVSGSVTGADVDGDALTYTKATDPAHGTAVVNTDGTYTYTPAADYNGPDSFTIEINDGHGGTTTVTVNITVTAVNDTPTGTGDTKTTLEDTPVSGSVTGTDTDGDALTYTKATDPAHGTVVVNPDGTYTYTPATDYNGPDSFTIEINDGHGGTTTVTVNITVTAVNDAPTGTGDTQTTTEDTPLSGIVTGSDVDGDPLTFTKATDPAHGTAIVTPSGSYTYTPNANYTGPDSFTIETGDGHGGTTTVTVNITVTPANDAPTGTGDTKTTIEDTPVSGAVTGTDPDGDALTFTKATDPAHGTVVVNADGTYTYTPAANYTGPDSFTIGISDGHGGTTTVTVNITVTPVNDAPTGTGDTRTTTEDTPVGGFVTGTDVDGDVLTFTKATDPAHGTVVVNPDGTYTYTPNANYTGPDSFTIEINDGHGGITTVTVNIIVTPANDAPTGIGDTQTTLEDTPVSGVVTGSDPDGDALTFTKATDPAHGTVVVNTDGTYTYTPAANYNGPDVFTININDGHGGIITVTVNITVIPVNDAPTGAGDTKTTPESTPVNGAVTGSDVDGDALTFTKATDPAHGTVIVSGSGAYTYTPAAGYTGPDSFTIEINDGHGGTTIVTVNITVTPVTVNAGISLIKVAVLRADGNSITYVFNITNTGDVPLHNITISDPMLGLNKTLPNDLQPGELVAETAVYKLTQADKTKGTVTNTATASGQTPVNTTVTDISGTAANNDTPTEIKVPGGPQARDDEAETKLNVPVAIPVLANDDVTTPATIAIVGLPTHGKVTVNEDGTVTYIPENGYTGEDNFTYQVIDKEGYTTNIATVTISVVESDIKIPTLFTPNGDGKNDVFEIRGLNRYPENELIIINRWGNEVFRQKNYQNNWNGNGLNEGTYYYLLRIKKTDGSAVEVFKGYTTIIRKFKQ